MAQLQFMTSLKEMQVPENCLGAALALCSQLLWVVLKWYLACCAREETSLPTYKVLNSNSLIYPVLHWLLCVQNTIGFSVNPVRTPFSVNGG